MKNNRNILVSINKSYLCHFIVMINSLIKNNADKFFTVYIMSADLTEEDYDFIGERFVSRDVTFKKIVVNDRLFDGFPTEKRYPVTIYFRILAPLLLPETVEKILYIDSDAVVHGDIDSLYNLNFDGNYFIACTQIKGFLHLVNMIRLGVGKDHVYMNTGVMMMNISELRVVTRVDEIRQYTLKNKWRMVLYDQDILCRFFGDRIKTVDPLQFNLADRRITGENLKRKDKIDCEWVDKNNVIIHYLGRNKPWKDNYSGILQKYYKEYDEE